MQLQNNNLTNFKHQNYSLQLLLQNLVNILHLHKYIPLMLYTRRGGRGISDIPPRRPRFINIT
jgi:hypothetical protein